MGDWIEIELGDVLDVVRNGTSTTQVGRVTSFPVTRIETISDWKIDYQKVGYVEKTDESYRLQKGDILFSNINSVKHIGKLAIYDGLKPLYHGMNLLLLRLADDVSKEYFTYLLTFNKKWFENRASQAVNQASINQTSIKELPLLIPKNKQEQSTIATILTTIDQAIEKTEQLIAKYERIKTGLMQDLLTRGIDEQGNIRSEETHEFKDSPLGRIPVEWDIYSLSELFGMKSGSTPHRKAFEKYFQNGKINWVKTLDLNEEFISTTDEKITLTAIKETSCSLLAHGTILIAMYGGWEQIGRTAILNIPSATNQAITALIEPRKEVSSEFIQYCLQRFRYKWKKFAVSTRKDPNITKTDIGNFIIPFPSFTEQLAIAEKVGGINKELSNERSLLEKYMLSKTALMQDLLTGKVRVDALINQDLETI